jgi:hypothetical protein
VWLDEKGMTVSLQKIRVKAGVLVSPCHLSCSLSILILYRFICATIGSWMGNAKLNGSSLSYSALRERNSGMEGERSTQPRANSVLGSAILSGYLLGGRTAVLTRFARSVFFFPCLVSLYLAAQHLLAYIFPLQSSFGLLQ